MLMVEHSLLQKLIQLHAVILATVLYCVLVVRPRRPGLPRLLASVPAFVAFSLSPFLVIDSAIFSAGINLTILWVANFKLLAYSGGRGALSHPGLRSGLQWGLLLMLPFFPAKSGRAPVKSSTGSVLMGLLVKLGVWLGLTAVLVGVDDLAPLARHLCYAVHFWMFISLCLDAGLPLGSQLLGHIPLQRAMDAPFAATSLRDFWGRRYNQIVSATLQETVYKPIVEGRWVSEKAAAAAAVRGPEDANVSPAPPSDAAGASVKGGNLVVRAGPAPAAPTEEAVAVPGSGDGLRRRAPTGITLAGLVAAFVVSGVMHEICLWFSCGGRLEGSFRMMGFFLLQPLLILGQDAASAAVAKLVPERFLLRGSKNWRAVAAGLRTAVTLALVLGSAEWFWGSLEGCGLDRQGVVEVDRGMRWLMEQARAAGLLAA